MESFEFWVGVDWAEALHAVCVLDARRNAVLETSVEHRGEALNKLAEQLIALAGGDPSRLAVAIETPRGPVVEALVDRKIAVFAINPKQLDRFRDRHTAAGAKDDRRDARVLADSLCTDMGSFRRVRLGDARLIQLREHTRMHEDLVQERVRVGNRLRDLLLRYFVDFLELGSIYHDAWLWELLELAPTPAKARALSVAKLKPFLRKHRVKRWSPEQVHEIFHRVPLIVADGVAEAASRHVGYLVQKLRLLDAQARDCERAVERLLEEEEPGPDGGPRDADILRSLPGVGTITSARLMAEAAQPLGDRDYRTLRSYCGASPVTRQSGKRIEVVQRHACNASLRGTVYQWALNAVRLDARARAHYAKLKACGHSHGRALRGVADRLLALLTAMLRQRTLFDSSRWNNAPLQPPALVPAG
jgi:transposase